MPVTHYRYMVKSNQTEEFRFMGSDSPFHIIREDYFLFLKMKLYFVEVQKMKKRKKGIHTVSIVII